MSSNISPASAWQAAQLTDRWKKSGSQFPKHTQAPPGTGSFGRFFHEVGWVTQLFTDQCQVDPWLLIETGIIAAVRAWWTVVDPDLKEAYHQIVGQSLVCSLKQEISDGHELTNSFYDGAKKTLFRTAEFVDLAVWKLFIASVIADGLADWQSMAQTMEGCRDTKYPWSSHTAFGAIPDVSQTYPGNGFDWVLNDPHFPAMAAVTQIHAGGTGYLIWVAQAKATNGDEVPVLSYIERGSDGAQIQPVQSIPKADGSGYHPIIQHFRAPILSSAESYTLRAHAIIPLPDGEAFFKSGFCASSNPFGF